MKNKNNNQIKILSILILMSVLSGCGLQSYNNCKPVLMPYIEYGYKAESQKLSESYTPKNGKTIVFHGVQVSLPPGWDSEKVFSGKTIKIFKSKDRFFIMSINKNKSFRGDDADGFSMVGRQAFYVGKHGKNKTDKEFYTDVYLFTKDQLDHDPDFWQYSILWAKTELLRDAVKLVHYTGRGLVAFQRNLESKFCQCKTIRTRIEVFPGNIAPDHFLSIAAEYEDDAFFMDFLEMLNVMNLNYHD